MPKKQKKKAPKKEKAKSKLLSKVPYGQKEVSKLNMEFC